MRQYVSVGRKASELGITTFTTTIGITNYYSTRDQVEYYTTTVPSLDLMATSFLFQACKVHILR
jgi:hypothetical protein